MLLDTTRDLTLIANLLDALKAKCRRNNVDPDQRALTPACIAHHPSPV